MSFFICFPRRNGSHESFAPWTRYLDDWARTGANNEVGMVGVVVIDRLIEVQLAGKMLTAIKANLGRCTGRRYGPCLPNSQRLLDALFFQRDGLKSGRL